MYKALTDHEKRLFDLIEEILFKAEIPLISFRKIIKLLSIKYL
jgi:hypothetical protein